MAKLIYLSPSNHGKGNNPCLKSGCYEDKHTRPMAEAAAKYLRANGFRAIVAKESQSMAERCAESDRLGADIHMPIHTNAAAKKSIRYLMFMCIRKTGEYLKMFNAIAPQLEAIYPEKKEAAFAQRTDLYEINEPKAKTFYCEIGFHTNKTDCDEFIHNADAIGKALAKGICKYYGVPFNMPIGIKEGSKVRVKQGAKDLNTGKQYKSFVYKTTYEVIDIKGSRVVFGLNGIITGAANKADLKLV